MKVAIVFKDGEQTRRIVGKLVKEDNKGIEIVLNDGRHFAVYYPYIIKKIELLGEDNGRNKTDVY